MILKLGVNDPPSYIGKEAYELGKKNSYSRQASSRRCQTARGTNGIRPEKLIPLDGNPVTIDVDVDVRLLLPFLIEQIADDCCDHEERTDYKIKTVTIHDQASQTVPRHTFLRQPSLLH